MIVSKIDNPSLELHIGDVEIKQVQKLNYLNSVVTDNGIYGIEI